MRRETMQEINGVGRPFQIQQPAPPEKTERKPRVEGESLKVGEKLNIAELLKEAKESPEVREKLVEQLKNAIEQGVYTIDPERIARHIMRQL
jgi:negative regulator of flagellin synthesis FlgM